MKIRELSDWVKTLASTNIEAVRFEESDQATWVKFQNNDTVYVYPSTRADFNALCDADSVGKHFHQHFRPIEFTKLTWDDEVAVEGEESERFDVPVDLQAALREIVAVVSDGIRNGIPDEAIIDQITPIVLRVTADEAARTLAEAANRS